MIKFKYRYCKAQMARYVSGDLSDAARRRVGRYINECEDCHAEYRRHREVALKLEQRLPTLGRANPQRLDQIWNALQHELQSPRTQSPALSDFAAHSTARFSYGLALLAITIALLLPMMIGFHTVLLPVDLPRLPNAAGIVQTPDAPLAARPFNLATAHSNARLRSPSLQNTPAPDL